ncbi:hypothetical protein BDP27DRAFT_1369993 [Rhodocollybia butyracea]|uniref:Uncharacterized protein n=1 Tax=Rhodocollybia butyracea TaxID=206335 RepID=A0A9P5PD92_9AGAR|nr:hypothetical protein BDP27DRAFT_1369993 [Rhodocollybia butyracea]
MSAYATFNLISLRILFGKALLKGQVLYTEPLERRPETRQEDKNSLQIAQIPMPASEWLAFLYNFDMYDLKVPEHGLFRGFILYRVFNSIFFGASSAFNGRVQQKVHSRQEWHAKYAFRLLFFCLARFALSYSDTWNRNDDDFSDAELYSEIVDCFEDDPKDESCTFVGGLEQEGIPSPSRAAR